MDRKVIIAFGVGVLAGIALIKIAPQEKPIGVLRVDESDPNEEPYLFLELNQDVSSVRTKKRVVFDVRDKNYLSAK